MNNLTVSFIDQTDRGHILCWATSADKGGIILVKDHPRGESEHVSAELVALSYLIFEKNVFCRKSIYSGKGMHIHVSSQQILDLTVSNCRELALPSHSTFMKSRLYGCKVSLIDSVQLELLTSANRQSEIDEIIFPLAADHSCLATPCMGLIRISEHAISQYVDRLKTGSPLDPLRSMAKRLMNPRIEPQKLPRAVTFHKTLKHGVTKLTEHWGHSSDDVHFVVVRDPQTKVGTVVTTYIRPPQFMVATLKST
ncbi:MAG: hypothetical protein EOO52_13685 [Gammaproteobacteria bacterium]|nr:MAG: hypothetical protein EOO52_13685 [Gammaproteobacteria bacterium]